MGSNRFALSVLHAACTCVCYCLFFFLSPPCPKEPYTWVNYLYYPQVIPNYIILSLIFFKTSAESDVARTYVWWKGMDDDGDYEQLTVFSDRSMTK